MDYLSIYPSFDELKLLASKAVDPNSPSIKISVLADNVSGFIVDALKGFGHSAGCNYNIYEAPLNRIETEILDSNSNLNSFKAEYVILLLSSQNLLEKFSVEENKNRISYALNKMAEIESYYLSINKMSPSKFICANFPEIDDGVFGNYSNKVAISFINQIRKLNSCLSELSQRYDDFYILDLVLLQNRHGRNKLVDSRLYANASMAFGLEITPAIAKQINDIIQAIKGKVKKCLIIDLDNTIWGGILAEDGIENIQIGSLGIGRIFTGIQQWIKSLIGRGIIVAVCSKNDEVKAKEVFEKHPDMILRLEDVTVFIANWQDKAENIRDIQKLLNIGLDSMVFLDDSYFERNLVRSSIPDICVPELPKEPEDFLEYIHALNLFETASFTETDKSRTEHYQQDAFRKQLANKYENVLDFLVDLKMTSKVQSFDSFNIPRIAQLTQRSNQFNLRTVRYSENDLKKMSSSNDFIGLCFTLKDKFGENGIISAVILKKQNNVLFIDTWVMSCRVLQRGVEHFVLNELMAVARKEKSEQLVGEYVPTKKNDIVKEHYLKMGFYPQAGFWKMDVNRFKCKKMFITKEEAEMSSKGKE